LSFKFRSFKLVHVLVHSGLQIRVFWSHPAVLADPFYESTKRDERGISNH
jgi:hypothetical protein